MEMEKSQWDLIGIYGKKCKTGKKCQKYQPGAQMMGGCARGNSDKPEKTGLFCRFDGAVCTEKYCLFFSGVIK